MTPQDRLTHGQAFGKGVPKKGFLRISLHFLGQPVPEHPYQDTDSYPSDCTWLWDGEAPNLRFNSYKMGKINRKNLRAQGDLKEIKGSSGQINSANLLRRQNTDLEGFFSRN